MFLESTWGVSTASLILNIGPQGILSFSISLTHSFVFLEDNLFSKTFLNSYIFWAIDELSDNLGSWIIYGNLKRVQSFSYSYSLLAAIFM